MCSTNVSCWSSWKLLMLFIVTLMDLQSKVKLLGSDRLTVNISNHTGIFVPVIIHDRSYSTETLLQNAHILICMFHGSDFGVFWGNVSPWKTTGRVGDFLFWGWFRVMPVLVSLRGFCFSVSCETRRRSFVASTEIIIIRVLRGPKQKATIRNQNELLLLILFITLSQSFNLKLCSFAFTLPTSNSDVNKRRKMR